MFWRGKHKFSHIEATGTAIGFGGGANSLLGGTTYFVHGGYGSDGYEGTNPKEPLATIEVAEAKLTAGKNDYIFAQGSLPITTEVPLLLDKKDIHIIGLGSGGYTQGLSFYGDATGVAISLKSYDQEIAGLTIASASASYDCMDSGVTTSYRNHIHHCAFGTNMLGKSGIDMWEISHCTIDNCLFGDMLAAYGIKSGSFVDVLIQDCFFYRNEEKCIYPSSGCIQLWIDRCRFYSPYADSEVIGWAITLPTGSTHCLVTNCQAATTGDNDAENKPYLDKSNAEVAQLTNGWSNNYFGDVLIDPGDDGDD